MGRLERTGLKVLAVFGRTAGAFVNAASIIGQGALFRRRFIIRRRSRRRLPFFRAADADAGFGFTTISHGRRFFRRRRGISTVCGAALSGAGTTAAAAAVVFVVVWKLVWIRRRSTDAAARFGDDAVAIRGNRRLGKPGGVPSGLRLVGGMRG